MTANAWISDPYAFPAAVIGVVFEFGFAKIFRNVLKCASGLMSFDDNDALVVGTLRTPFEKIASAWLSVVRYLTSAHASSLFFTPFGMPMIVPFT